MMAPVFAILVLVSTALVLWQWLCGWRFPLHESKRHPDPSAPVTVFKPVKGWDTATRACLESWLVQVYPEPVQILFGVDDDDEQARAGVLALIADHPAAQARMISCHRRLGPHPKVAKLVQIDPHAAHDVLVASDADVWVPPDFLAQTVPLLADPRTGMVNCFYSQPPAPNLAMLWMNIAINADFWTQVLQFNSMKPQDFALGAVMMTRRREIDEIGGFGSCIDYLADDYQLGHRIAGLGRRIVLSSLVVECRSAPMTGAQVWNHQLRQGRTLRASHPVLYFLSIINNVTLWSALWLLAAPGWPSAGGAALAQAVRIATAFHNEWRLSRAFPPPWLAWTVPVKDLLHFAVWIASFLGRTICWRGERYRLESGGKLARLDAVPEEPRTVARPVEAKKPETKTVET